MILYLKARSDLRKTPEDREFSNWHALNRPILLRIMRSVWTDLYCATKRLTNNRCQLQELRQNIFVFPDECAKSSRCRNRERWKAFRRFSWVPKICNTFWPTLQESLPCDSGAMRRCRRTTFDDTTLQRRRNEATFGIDASKDAKLCPCLVGGWTGGRDTFPPTTVASIRASHPLRQSTGTNTQKLFKHIYQWVGNF